jgi:hypothetical protein
LCIEARSKVLKKNSRKSRSCALKPGAKYQKKSKKIEKLCIEACNIRPLRSPPSALKLAINRQNEEVSERLSYFFCVFNSFDFVKFYSTRYFEFLNSILTKNLKMDSSFFRIFYFKNLQIFKSFKFDWLVF